MKFNALDCVYKYLLNKLKLFINRCINKLELNLSF